MAEAKSYKDPSFDSLDEASAAKVGIDPALLRSIRLNGERSNSDQVSSAGARTSYQITPTTRKLIEEKYGIDPWLNDKNASLGAAYLLKESLDRNKGDTATAVREYVGGVNPDNHGPVTRAYEKRVMAGLPALQTKQPAPDIGSDFDKWLAARPSATQKAAESAVGAVTGSGPAQAAQPASNDINAAFDAWQAQQPGLGAELKRGLGLGTRSLIEGVGEGAGLVYDPIAATINAVTGSKIPTAGTQASNLATALGLPTPETGNERLFDAAQRFAASSLPTIGLGSVAESASQAPRIVQEVGKTLAAAPGAQVTAAGAGGLASEAARQAGAGTAGQVVAGLAGSLAPGGAARVAEAAAPTIAKGTQAARTAAEELASRVRPGEPTSGPRSVGAAEVPEAALRRANAQDLPVPVDLTKGQATREFAQQQFEREVAKQPEIGAPIRERLAEQNQKIQQNLDAFIDASGAEATNLRDAGIAVDKAIRDSAAKAKNEIRVAYKNAEKSAESASPVATNEIVDLLNNSVSAESTAPILKTARKELIRLGGAVEDESGNLVPRDMSLKNTEQMRKLINSSIDSSPSNIKFGSDIKRAIDNSTDGVGGELYNRARRLRSKFAKEYENRAVISDLLNRKRGSDDRRVAFEDVVDRVVNRGSLDDVRFARKILQTSGEDGRQAWREIQGATLQDIKDQATKNVARDEAGNAIISPAALDKAIRRLETDGKLDFIFGKRGAEQLRTINDVANDLFTAPPGSVNTSNTSSALLLALDSAISAGFGIPAPVTHLLKMAQRNIKDRKLKARVIKALEKPAAKKETF